MPFFVPFVFQIIVVTQMPFLFQNITNGCARKNAIAYCI